MVSLPWLREFIISALYDLKVAWKTNNALSSQKMFGNEKVKALLEEDCCQIQEELAESCGVAQAVIVNWVPIELKPRETLKGDLASQICPWMLQKVVGFWIGFWLVMKTRSITYVHMWSLPTSHLTAKPNVHGVNVNALYFSHLECKAFRPLKKYSSNFPSLLWPLSSHCRLKKQYSAR